MKKTKRFKDQNAVSQNIDTTKKFIVLRDRGENSHTDDYSDVGDILKLVEDDGSSMPRFKNLNRPKQTTYYEYWSCLSYADEDFGKVEGIDDERVTPGIRQFESGANRNSGEGKLDYHLFNSALVNWYYAQYMYKHSLLEDGTKREGDNWQKGIPTEVLKASLARHYADYHLSSSGLSPIEDGKLLDEKDILCGIIFNAKALLLEKLKGLKNINRNFDKEI